MALLTSCAAPAVTTVDLSVLALEQEAWHGRDVETTGTVQTFASPRHFWIEDADQNRVELTPSDGLMELVGRTVTVTGRFTFREGEGRRIAVEDLEVLDP